jgi:hypothetical protein
MNGMIKVLQKAGFTQAKASFPEQQLVETQ